MTPSGICLNLPWSCISNYNKHVDVTTVSQPIKAPCILLLHDNSYKESPTMFLLASSKSLLSFALWEWRLICMWPKKKSLSIGIGSRKLNSNVQLMDPQFSFKSLKLVIDQLVWPHQYQNFLWHAYTPLELLQRTDVEPWTWVGPCISGCDQHDSNQSICP
jgi:hypothetical protein